MVDIFNISLVILGGILFIFPVMIYFSSQFFAIEWGIFMAIGVIMMILGIKWYFGPGFGSGR